MDVIFYLGWKSLSPHVFIAEVIQSFQFGILYQRNFLLTTYHIFFVTAPSSWHVINAHQLFGECVNDLWLNERKNKKEKKWIVTKQNLFSLVQVNCFQVLVCKLLLPGRFFWFVIFWNLCNGVTFDNWVLWYINGLGILNYI